MRAAGVYFREEGQGPGEAAKREVEGERTLLPNETSIETETEAEGLENQLKTPIVFDGRNQYNAFNLEEKGFEYHQIGKQS